MKQLYCLLLLCSTFAFGQNWKTISLNEDIEFDFPEGYIEKDSANLKTFSAETSEGLYVVSKTIEKTHVLSWDKIRILNLYKSFQKDVMETHDGELVSDEIVEFLNVKTAKFVIRKFENSKYITRYYLVFYYKGHLYTFEFTDTSDNLSGADWNRQFYNEISIGNQKLPVETEQTATETADSDKMQFSYILLIPLVFIIAAVLILFFILWKRNKEDRRVNRM